MGFHGIRAIDGQLRDPDKPFSAAGASLMFPRDTSGPAAETVNCGCQSLPWMESWEVQHPGRKAGGCGVRSRPGSARQRVVDSSDRHTIFG